MVKIPVKAILSKCNKSLCASIVSKMKIFEIVVENP